MLRYLVPFATFVVLGGFLYVGLQLNPRDIESTRIDKPAPSFEVSTVLDADKTLNSEEFKGKVSIFNTWASWCVSCRQEHPLLMDIANQTDIPVYGLNFKDKLADAQGVLKGTGNPYVVSGFDPKGRVGMDWGVRATPETFIVDQDGIVRYKHTGPLSVPVLTGEILPLIKHLREQENKDS
ncbi:DsbE family thiol:disulfide interchange protein [Candidatus Albibeggiatoa sp. nov. NOAA]|uniref:DsbE family thiol:disulfide interchange protein n=1 Tax=Candidatus Albibeggiatoa sp. nov. NOAA TaxID=3162724 RepID=UPI0032FFC2A6|nr:DsbE family thiol:disulfide interchange protein [Thiotrichaceae bacterium]